MNKNYEEYDEEIEEVDDDIEYDITPSMEKRYVKKRSAHTTYKLLVTLWPLVLCIVGVFLLLVAGRSSEREDAIVWIVIGAILCVLHVVFLWVRLQNTYSYFRQLEQSIDQAASQVDIYIKNRVTLMKSLAKMVGGAKEQELHLLLGVAQERSGGDVDKRRNAINSVLDQFILSVEAYPEMASLAAVQQMMREDERCVSNITAARTLYNDMVAKWNTEIFDFGVREIVAAEQGYSTRFSFAVGKSTRIQNDNSDFE